MFKDDVLRYFQRLVAEALNFTCGCCAVASSYSQTSRNGTDEITNGELKYNPETLLQRSRIAPRTKERMIWRKISDEHIGMAMNAWAHPDGEKVPAAKITKAYFELGMTFPELYDDSHPEALARNTQKIFRWVEKDTPDAVEKIQALLPAIEKAMPPLLVARMRSHSSAYFRELVETRERLVRDADDFVAVAIAGFNQMNRGGPAGNAVAVH